MNADNPNIENSQALDFERIRVLFDNMRVGYLGVAAGFLLLYLTLQHFASSSVANLWLSASLVVNIPRIIVSYRFAEGLRAGRIDATNVRPWEWRLTWACILSYLCTLSVLFMPYGEDATIAVLLCAFVCMVFAVGGVLMLSTSPPSIITYLTLLSVAIVVRFVMLPDPFFSWIAAIYIVGYVQLLRQIIKQHRLLIENINLKIENTQIALFDPLTKLANRRQLNVVLDTLLPTAQRTGDPFSVIILDIDDFKGFNDRYGHNGGDKLLVRIAGVLKACTRKQDLVARYGGDEFLVILPRTNAGDAEVMAERIRLATREETHVTISAGLAEYSGEAEFDLLLKRADAALYTAKHSGRDRYVVSDAPPVETVPTG